MKILKCFLFVAAATSLLTLTSCLTTGKDCCGSGDTCCTGEAAHDHAEGDAH